MATIDAGKMSDEDLVAYDRWMIGATLAVADIGSLAMAVWKDVLSELERRKLVTIIGGTLDDLGNALIQRH